MNEFDTCERCKGSGADPVQSFEIDEVTLCVECRGDGVVLLLELHGEPLRLSA